MNAAPDPLDPDTVHDCDSFLAFVAAMADDRRASVSAERVSPSSPYGPDAGGWENITIQDFLDAAIRWAVDSDMGTRQGLPAGPSWKTFACFLLGGKGYE